MVITLMFIIRHLLPAGKSLNLERGLTLGGSSAINYLMWVHGQKQDWAVTFIPMPLPRRVPQTSYCTHLLFKDVLQTGLGRGTGYEWHSSRTSRAGRSSGAAGTTGGTRTWRPTSQPWRG